MNRPLKNKTRPKPKDAEVRKPTTGRDGGGPDKYDGRANLGEQSSKEKK